jgi:hypothetical protein
MNIKDFLSPTDTHVDVRASDKSRLLQELARRAASSLNFALRVTPPASTIDDRIASSSLHG